MNVMINTFGTGHSNTDNVNHTGWGFSMSKNKQINFNWHCMRTDFTENCSAKTLDNLFSFSKFPKKINFCNIITDCLSYIYLESRLIRR